MGKTSLLERSDPHRQVIRCDDHAVRNFAKDNPRIFLDQFAGPILIDEAPLVEEFFPELKRRVDQDRRLNQSTVDVWLTGSNQTLLRQNVRESLAGRASYFDLNTLSIHELGNFQLGTHLLRGGWPELAVDASLSHVRYLNDLIATFVDRDIAMAAGIERKSAFSKVLGLVAARQGMLMNYSEIAGVAGVDVTTVQSWILILEENGLLRRVEAYSSNLNKRLTKAPKIFFEDVGMASRLQGWTDSGPLILSPQLGFHLEAIVLGEVTRFFTSRGESAKVFHVRSKEKVEVDFLVELPNQRFLAIEVKATPQNFSADQFDLLDSLKLPRLQKWIVSPSGGESLPAVVPFHQIFEKLLSLLAD